MCKKGFTISHKGCRAIFESALLPEYKRYSIEMQENFRCRGLEDGEHLCKNLHFWPIIFDNFSPMQRKMNAEQNTHTFFFKNTHISIQNITLFFSHYKSYVFEKSCTKLRQHSHHMIDQFVEVVCSRIYSWG